MRSFISFQVMCCDEQIFATYFDNFSRGNIVETNEPSVANVFGSLS